MTVQSPSLTRHVALESMFNVRDLGGQPARAGQTVRWHRVYRADNLARANRRDLATLADLGIKTVIDLRTDREALREPSPTVFPHAYLSHHHLPMLRATWDEVGYEAGADVNVVDFLAARYVEMMVEGAPAIAEALRILASPSRHPALFHCSMGKDRTGVLAAVLLSLLGAKDETIAADYALSSLGVAAFAESLAATNPNQRAAFDETPAAYLAAPPDAMLRVLQQVRERGRSMIGYVRSIGIDFETIEALHMTLLS